MLEEILRQHEFCSSPNCRPFEWLSPVSTSNNSVQRSHSRLLKRCYLKSAAHLSWMQFAWEVRDFSLFFSSLRLGFTAESWRWGGSPPGKPSRHREIRVSPHNWWFVTDQVCSCGHARLGGHGDCGASVEAAICYITMVQPLINPLTDFISCITVVINEGIWPWL